MAGDMEEAESQETQETDHSSSFVWDQTTQLYFHASTGFYHDPSAGWYYSSRDGLYYKYENGNYVPLESKRVDTECETNSYREITAVDNPVQDEPRSHVYLNRDDNFYSLPLANDSDAYQYRESDLDESTAGYKECSNIHESENPPPPSEWLEETLIDLYLRGSKKAINASDGPVVSLEMDVDNCNNKIEEGDQITGDCCGLIDPGETIIDEDASRDEENWRAQYGQVVHSGEEPMANFHIVDLWDWEMVKGSRKIRKCQEARLVGRLVKQSAKLHPSMPSSHGFYRTSPICEVHLDLVRVRTGKVYKLRSPSSRYLASLSTYDSSNPTKDWGFPELLISMQDRPLTIASGKAIPPSADGDADSKCTTMLPNHLLTSKMQVGSHEYRDRAAERRTLHGGFGVGPGQKSSLVGDLRSSSFPDSISSEEAAAEALHMSFGAGSYARKILANMGWKEGEGLGNTTKGLVEPIKAVGNTGNAGLGWPQSKRKHQPTSGVFSL